MPIVGGLIAESLRVGAVLEGVPLIVTKISRADVGDVDAGQPRRWTFLEFEARDEDAMRLADTLEGVLAVQGGWYCDFHSDTETLSCSPTEHFDIHAAMNKAAPTPPPTRARVGVPEAQLDWPV